MLGLEGELPEASTPTPRPLRVAAVAREGKLRLLGTARRDPPLRAGDSLVFHRRQTLPRHPNGMRFTPSTRSRALSSRVYYSVGGGFVVNDRATPTAPRAGDRPQVPHPFRAGPSCSAMPTDGLSHRTLMLENERALRPEAEVRAGAARLWEIDAACVKRGCEREGILPGGLKVRRRAAALHRRLRATPGRPRPAARHGLGQPLGPRGQRGERRGGPRGDGAHQRRGGHHPRGAALLRRFVPAPTTRGWCASSSRPRPSGCSTSPNASISGAEVGCQGEVGVACSMAAAGLAEVLGGTPEQVENAAEIGMEHNLGLTCDPIGGLVQVPCIERNAMGAVKAINAARLAMNGRRQAQGVARQGHRHDARRPAPT
jgi:L-serine dehydratase